MVNVLDHASGSDSQSGHVIGLMEQCRLKRIDALIAEKPELKKKEAALRKLGVSAEGRQELLELEIYSGDFGSRQRTQVIQALPLEEEIRQRVSVLFPSAPSSESDGGKTVTVVLLDPDDLTDAEFHGHNDESGVYQRRITVRGAVYAILLVAGVVGVHLVTQASHRNSSKEGNETVDRLPMTGGSAPANYPRVSNALEDGTSMRDLFGPWYTANPKLDQQNEQRWSRESASLLARWGEDCSYAGNDPATDAVLLITILGRKPCLTSQFGAAGERIGAECLRVAHEKLASGDLRKASELALTARSLARTLNAQPVKFQECEMVLEEVAQASRAVAQVVH